MNIPVFITSLDLSLTNTLFAIGAAVLSFIVIHGAVAFFRKRLNSLSESGAHSAVAEVLRQTLARTSKLAVIATALLIGLSVLDLPPKWEGRVSNLWFITLGIQLALYAHRAIAVSAQRYFRRRAPVGGEDEQVTVAHTFITWILQIAVWVVFLLATLSNLGVNVSTLVASLGIGGIAVALAVQNVLGDLFASLSIAVDKPFEVGDSISVAGFSGKVEHVGLKTTRVRADSGEQIVISNAQILKDTLRNFKRMTTRRVQFALQVNPDTPPALAGQIPAALRAIIERQDKVRFDRAHLKTLAPESIGYEVVYFVLDPNYTLFMDTQQIIILEMMQLLDDLGISTAPRPQPVQVMAAEVLPGPTAAAPVRPTLLKTASDQATASVPAPRATRAPSG
ncbi:mechanosensitive ion channel family protein [Massilia sp. S19_KUP03_FR1]|uniref:mechanosensitive ion channel family protein n=1 Tax=Massilia sp. S19_KUP03_FR1 TaxID=3025503 RepID=UPI002FCD9FE3